MFGIAFMKWVQCPQEAQFWGHMVFGDNRTLAKPNANTARFSTILPSPMANINIHEVVLVHRGTFDSDMNSAVVMCIAIVGF